MEQNGRFNVSGQRTWSKEELIVLIGEVLSPLHKDNVSKIEAMTTSFNALNLAFTQKTGELAGAIKFGAWLIGILVVVVGIIVTAVVKK